MNAKESMDRDTRNLILDAAIDLFVEAGFESTPMDSIATAAGVAKGTLYYHFKSKEGIVDAALERYAIEIESALGGIVGDGAKTALAKMISMIETISIASRRTFRKLHKLRFIDVHKKSGEIILSRLVPYFARIIEEGIEAKLWQTEYPLEYAEIFSASIQALLDPEGGWNRFAQRGAALVSLFEKGLAMAPGSLRPVLESLNESLSPTN